ncbi:MAG: hypothetical protein JRF63_15875 [Deltaproteobacteria bacterium]|nr:hypothetical protein [Deltaproteobacteria bacterium]
MTRKSLEHALSKRGADPARLARTLAKSPDHVEIVVRGLHAETATVRFNSSKILLEKSAAIRTLGYMAPVDSAGRITRSMAKVLEPIPGPDLVVACNAIEGAARIAQARPKQKTRIVESILSVRRGRYRTPECRNIAIGQAIDALDGLTVGAAQRKTVDEFVRRQRKNPRKSTQARAERFLRRRQADGGGRCP